MPSAVSSSVSVNNRSSVIMSTTTNTNNLASHKMASALSPVPAQRKSAPRTKLKSSSALVSEHREPQVFAPASNSIKNQSQQNVSKNSHQMAAAVKSPARVLKSPIGVIQEEDEINNRNDRVDTVAVHKHIKSIIKSPTRPVDGCITSPEPSRYDACPRGTLMSPQPVSNAAKRNSIFSWTRKRAIRFMSTVNQSIDQINVSVQSFLSPPPESSVNRPKTNVLSSAARINNANSTYQHYYGRNMPNPTAANYYPKGDPFWYHKAFYDSRSKTTLNGAQLNSTQPQPRPQRPQPPHPQQFVQAHPMQHFYYVYEKGYIKKKWVTLLHLLLPRSASPTR